MSGDTLQLRHHRPFVAFWFARICTAGSFQMLTVAIGWHLYSLTGNVLDLGLVGLGGVGTLVITGVWMKLFPGLARRDRLTEPRQDS